MGGRDSHWEWWTADLTQRERNLIEQAESAVGRSGERFDGMLGRRHQPDDAAVGRLSLLPAGTSH
jgi:hypothetical protein